MAEVIHPTEMVADKVDLFQMVNLEIILDKINIIQISQKLRLSKETARRKILELETDGILVKNKKKISVTLKAGLLQKPEITINSFSKILQYVSWLLYKGNKVNKYYEKNKKTSIPESIKKRIIEFEKTVINFI